jgi:hypothetical protein
MGWEMRMKNFFTQKDEESENFLINLLRLLFSRAKFLSKAFNTTQAA